MEKIQYRIMLMIMALGVIGSLIYPMGSLKSIGYSIMFFASYISIILLEIRDVIKSK